MKAVTASQMALIDKYAIEKMGIPGEMLMDCAGKKVAQAVYQLIGKFKHDKNVVFFAWKGNNGGDAFAAARHLLSDFSNIGVKLVLLCQPDDIRGYALPHYKSLVESFPDCVIHAETLDKLLEARDVVSGACLIVDGIFGTGFSGIPSGHPAEAIFFINSLNKTVLSIDIPSGVNGDTGAVDRIAVKAKYTVTLGLPKLGLLCGEGIEHSGKIKIVDIGFPNESVVSVSSGIEVLTKNAVSRVLPNRMENSHKNTFGHLFVLAGSMGMAGAAALASQSALRAGCGMVTLGCPKSMVDVLSSKLTEVIILPCSETEDITLHKNCIDKVFDVMEKRKCGALLVGPGLGKHLSTTELVKEIIKVSPYPLIIDADALNAVATVKSGVFKTASVPVVITPHPGELARLIGLDVGYVQSNRQTAAEKFSSENNTVTVLKGKNTLITSTDSKTFINLTGNSGLATAGSGDVLAGIIGSFIVQGMNAVDSACCGVFYHGLAGDFAVRKLGKRGVIASDIIKFLPKALK